VEPRLLANIILSWSFNIHTSRILLYVKHNTKNSHPPAGILVALVGSSVIAMMKWCSGCPFLRLLDLGEEEEEEDEVNGATGDANGHIEINNVR